MQPRMQRKFMLGAFRAAKRALEERSGKRAKNPQKKSARAGSEPAVPQVQDEKRSEKEDNHDV